MVHKDSQPRDTRPTASNWVSIKLILFFVLLVIAGFLLTGASSATASGLQDVLFGSGILLWIVGVFGTVYCIVRRLAGPRAAKLAVLALLLILLSEVIFSKRRGKNHDLLDDARE